jgi:hypothetical protein
MKKQVTRDGLRALPERRPRKPKSSGAIGRNKPLTLQELRALEKGLRASLRSSSEERCRGLQGGFTDSAGATASRNRPLTPKQQRALGTMVRSVAREKVDELRRLLQSHGFADVDEMIERSDLSYEAAADLYATDVAVPVLMVAEVAAILATVPASNRRGRRSLWSRAAAQRLLNEGMSKHEISKRLAAPGVSPGSIRRKLHGMTAAKAAP